MNLISKRWTWLCHGTAIWLLLGSAHAVERGVVQLDPAQQQSLGIIVGPVRSAAAMELSGLPATAQPPLQGSLVITAPFAGITSQVRVREGDQVQRGQILALLASPEAMTVAANLASAEAELQVAQAADTRDRQLLADGIIPAARAELSRMQLGSARARVQQWRNEQGLAPAAQSGQYQIRAPQDGRVLVRSVQPGDAVPAWGRVFVLAAGDRIDLDIYVPERYAGQLQRGQRVRLADGSEAALEEIGGQLDPVTQTVRVRASFSHQHLLPGAQTTVSLRLPVAPGLLQIPVDALVSEAGKSLVYVRERTGFRAVPVVVVSRAGDATCLISSKLSAQAQIVTAGASALRAIDLGGG